MSLETAKSSQRIYGCSTLHNTYINAKYRLELTFSETWLSPPRTSIVRRAEWKEQCSRNPPVFLLPNVPHMTSFVTHTAWFSTSSISCPRSHPVLTWNAVPSRRCLPPWCVCLARAHIHNQCFRRDGLLNVRTFPPENENTRYVISPSPPRD